MRKWIVLGLLAAFLLCAAAGCVIEFGETGDEEGGSPFTDEADAADFFEELGVEEGDLTVRPAPAFDAQGRELDGPYGKKEETGERHEVPPVAHIPPAASPAEAAELWFSALKDGDLSTALALSKGFEGLAGLAAPNAALYENLRWRILDTGEEDGEAFCSAEVENGWYYDLLHGYFYGDILQDASAGWEEQLAGKVDNLVKKAPVKSHALVIRLEPADGGWQVVLTEELLDAATGGAARLVRELRGDSANREVP